MNLTYSAVEEEFSENVKKVPGKIYLCQYKSLSCGACCGIYNFNYKSVTQFYEVLAQRTLNFEASGRNLDEILNFGEKELLKISAMGEKPFPDFHHCPYAGFIDKNNETPGCLLHPLSEKNSGVDFRGLSFYGGLACASYFCSTYFNVSPQRKIILRDLFEDSYEYGLVVTESEMINTIFDSIEKNTKSKTDISDINFETSELLKSVFRLKFEWPFKREKNHPANYFFTDQEKTEKINPLCRKSEFYYVLDSVNALIKDEKDLAEAEGYIKEKIKKVSDSLLRT
ncbi:MAG: hypothetical protein ACQEQS_09750 [Thermodesulfobacteriota bacterium]